MRTTADDPPRQNAQVAEDGGTAYPAPGDGRDRSARRRVSDRVRRWTGPSLWNQDFDTSDIPPPELRPRPGWTREEADLAWWSGVARRVGYLGVRRRRSADQLQLFDPGPVRATVDLRSIRVDPMARGLVVAAVVGYVALFLHWTFEQHDGLGTQAFDIGIFDQGMWLLSRFKRPFITLNGRNLFGDHTSFILIPFAVVYTVLPSIKVLLVSQTVALALGAWPAFLIARHKLRNEMFAALFAVVYLVHPVVGWANLSEHFHPDAFEVPLVLLTFWFVLQGRWRAYGVCIVALLLIKEDVAFLTFAMGLYVARYHDRRVGRITCIASAAYLVTAFWILIPAFLGGGGTVYTGRIPFGGPTGFLRRAFTHPGDVFSLVTEQARLWYVWQLLAPLAFVALLAPGVLLIAAGPLVLNLVSGFAYQFDVRYHYSTLILPVLVIATIFGVASLPRRMHSLAVGLVLAMSLWSAYLWSPTPIGRTKPFIANPDAPHVASFHRAARMLPTDAIVSAHYGYVPQISHREGIYVFPNPWRASYWGTFQREGQRLPQADDVEYVMVPSQLDAEPRTVLDSIRGEFDTVYDEGGVLLLKRRI